MEKRKSLKQWWQDHKPTKRRLIQVYAALLYNAYAKGFIQGEIFTGMTKNVCVPGLNCYSCPGAVGACPLGALQNALADSKTRAPYYMFGIILLYGLILGRTICGFLCPVGFAQDLLYKIRTPKLKKSRITRALSYFKYVILAVLVIGVPLIYAVDHIAVPGFCKYICPAGTFGGAFALLLHPDNDPLYTMLGPLFTWKVIVLVIVVAACIFIYRAFCRFLCPLGAIYGLFNRYALLGVRLDRSKCTDCGKCVSHCKMDIRHVGDHECINCGECMAVCPVNAITWKGRKAVIENTCEPGILTEEATEPEQIGKNPPANRKKTILQIVSTALAGALLIGVFTYANFFAGKKKEEDTPPPVTVVDQTYELVISYRDDDATGLLSFRIGESERYAIPISGNGTKDDPYVISSIEGNFDIPINHTKGAVYFVYTSSDTGEYTVTSAPDDLRLRIYRLDSGKETALYDYETDGSTFRFSAGVAYGNTEGFLCYDVTLNAYNGKGSVTLSELRGKIVIINFWGYWCGPCVQELPDFEAVRNAYENVEVIAVHSPNPTIDVQAWLVDKQWDTWNILFVQDTAVSGADSYYDLLGGRNGAYPRTLILDENGIVRYVVNKSISEKTLVSAVESILASE